jgi:hypothetical protein
MNVISKLILTLTSELRSAVNREQEIKSGSQMKNYSTLETYVNLGLTTRCFRPLYIQKCICGRGMASSQHSPDPLAGLGLPLWGGEQKVWGGEEG